MAATITEDITHVVFSNPLATLKLKKANAASEILTISGGDNIITPPVRFVAYHDGSNLIEAQSVSYMSTNTWEGVLSFEFTNGQVICGVERMKHTFPLSFSRSLVASRAAPPKF